MFYGQDEEKEMDWHIESELQQNMNLPESELVIAHVYFSDIMEDSWENCRCFLQDINSREKDPLRKTPE